jgi:hypothetical protein
LPISLLTQTFPPFLCPLLPHSPYQLNISVWFPTHISLLGFSCFSPVILQGTLTGLQEEFQYCCSLCNKTFTEQRKPKAHQRIHSGKRPFSCYMRNKSFSEQSNLKAHQHLHSGKGPFCCKVFYVRIIVIFILQ